MLLMIIDAADVKDGEPRRWFPSAESAQRWLDDDDATPARWGHASHGRSRDAHNIAHWTHAIVDRPAPPVQAPAEEPRADIKAAREWAKLSLNPGFRIDEADRNAARVILACTPPDLATAVRALPDVGGVATCCPHPVGRHAYNGCADCGCGVRWEEHPLRFTDPDGCAQMETGKRIVAQELDAALARVSELEGEVARLRDEAADLFDSGAEASRETEGLHDQKTGYIDAIAAAASTIKALACVADNAADCLDANSDKAARREWAASIRAQVRTLTPTTTTEPTT